ncbi:MAG: helix-turn-helix domain-containing protein [Propionicimonas sp.]|uniref:winged helix-turn-helix domain-containing protein n=1 Tax=Propionicimonas sp. TaxID=1955623 RepID=UPI002B2010AF|nr:helix-turn-helix domain-containing protein [Propionicimonas sp.]MEA4943435.1 helix-turn-helix domain-containing protein [Propionicimonas sp.]MEA5119474.1 helix-turn-helix domain-containing protein [Propionicimonas sp.]
MSTDDTAGSRPFSHLELDATAVKVLAHPLRSRLLSALRVDGPASATNLATRLHTNTGATSYHLRKLAEVGLVADTGRGRGKERIWQAATQSHGWLNSAFAEDEDARTALDWLVRKYHRDFDQQYAAWLDVADTWPARWQDVSGMNDTWVEVTAAQARAMFTEIDAVIEKYRKAGAGQADARRLHSYRIAFPLDPADPPDQDAAG